LAAMESFSSVSYFWCMPSLSTLLLSLREPPLSQASIIWSQSTQQIPYYLTTRWTHFPRGYSHSNRMVPRTNPTNSIASTRKRSIQLRSAQESISTFHTYLSRFSF
jgi:hypothetical protein